MTLDCHPIIYVILLTLALTSTVISIEAKEDDARFYVAANGNDDWSGRSPAPNRKGSDGPFATLERARDAIRHLKAQGKLKANSQSSKPVTVLLRGGTYSVSKPFVLGPEDSGTATCPIAYAAYANEKPVLSGGRRIAGWKRGEGQLWTAEVPAVKEGGWYFRQLFVNGGLRRRPRPRQVGGYYAVVGPIVAEKWDDPQNAKAFHYKPGDLRKSWTNLEDVEVVVNQYWTEARLRIASVDDQTNTVTFTGPSWRPLTWSRGYAVENVYEALDAPGQWYLNRKTGILTYWPLPGEDMTRAEVIAPSTEQLLRVEGDVDAGRFVQHVTVRGLTFRYTNAPLAAGGHAIPQAEVPVPAAVYAVGARHCSFEGNEIAQVGQWGVELSRGCQDNRIVGNHIHDIGAGGIKVGEEASREKDVDEACRTLITDNEVFDGNKLYMGAPAIWIGQSGSNLIAHNEIHGAWEWAISVGWTWEYLPPNRARDNIVEYNHIHDFDNIELGTHAAIYCLGLSPGTVVRNNLIHDIKGNGTGGYGIILDQGCAGVLVENNVVHHTDGGWCSNFHCIGNTILNNIFALTREAAMHRYGDSPPAGYTLSNCNICCRNIFYWKEGRLEQRDDWLDFGTVQDYNVFFDVRGGPVKILKYSLEEWRAKGLDRSSIVADPLFVDPEGGDLTLKPESPAFKLGFRPIDLSGVGPRLSPRSRADADSKFRRTAD